MRQMQRMIKPSILYKSKLLKLGKDVRWFYLGLILTADREGRLEDECDDLRLLTMGHDTEITADNISVMVDSLVRVGLLLRYEVDGEKCIQLTSEVGCHPNESPSKLPAPQEVTVASANQAPTNGVASPLLQEKKGKVKRSKVKKYEGTMDEQLQAWADDWDNDEAIRGIIRNVRVERYKNTPNTFLLESDSLWVESEIGSMKNWLISNPDKSYTRWGQFVSGWLKRANVTKGMTVAQENEHFAGKARTGGKSDFEKVGE